MDVRSIHLTQSGFRLSCLQFAGMVEFVSSGGFYTQQALINRNPNRKSLIAINQFEDGEFYVRDGMHRLASIYIGGRTKLREDEFFVEQWTYDQYREINLDTGWFTPFDPKFEVRRPDFFDFKKEVQLRISRGVSPIDFIRRERLMYCVLRTDEHDWIGPLAEEYWRLCAVTAV